MKRQKHIDNVLKFDVNAKAPKESQTNKKSTNKVLSMMVNCSVCNKQITKNNVHDGMYLCNKCKHLTLEDIYIKIADAIDNALLDDPIFYLDKEELQYLIELDNNDDYLK